MTQLFDYPSLTAEVHRLVLALGDRRKAAPELGLGQAPPWLDAHSLADLIDKKYQTLMSELSRQDGHKFGADLVLPICKYTGSVAPIRMLCREMNGEFVPLMEAAAGAEELVRTLAEALEAFGRFAAEAGRSIADGHITAEELESIESAGQNMVALALAFIKLARATYKAQKANSERADHA